MLKLVLLRHAKSSWDTPGIDDFERPLNERGRAAAPVIGRALRELRIVPDVVLCSGAKRTRETLDGLHIDRSHHPKIQYEDGLYLADPHELLDWLKRVPETARCVMLVGHNPGLHALAASFAETGESREIARLADKFPTGALAYLTLPQNKWADIAPATGHLEAFITPRDRMPG